MMSPPINKTKLSNVPNNFFDFKIKDIEGKVIDFKTYKNKRAIKQMAKFGDANNLTNFQIGKSINLRIEIKSNSKVDSG